MFEWYEWVFSIIALVFILMFLEGLTVNILETIYKVKAEKYKSIASREKETK